MIRCTSISVERESHQTLIKRIAQTRSGVVGSEYWKQLSIHDLRETMCTTVMLAYITCGHKFRVERHCHQHPTCKVPTNIDRSKGGECWDCDPGQAPPAVLFTRVYSWKRVKDSPKRDVSMDPVDDGSLNKEGSANDSK